VRDRLRVFSDELRAGIVCSGMNGGTHEKTLEMMQLFAEEVMPHFREDAAVDETVGVGREVDPRAPLSGGWRNGRGRRRGR
jgi:hypothetical protein